MAVFDNITLNGDKLLVQDTATANSVMQVNEQVQDIITAVDGKPTADVTYDDTTSTLKIDTDTISINTNTPAILSADGDIASISLNGVAHTLSSGGGTMYTMSSNAFPALNAQQIASLITMYLDLSIDDVAKAQVTVLASGNVIPQHIYTPRFILDADSGKYNIAIYVKNTATSASAAVVSESPVLYVNVYIPAGTPTVTT